MRVPPKSLSVRVDIQEDHFDPEVADPEDPTLNPIALAIAGAIPEAKYVAVDSGAVEVVTFGGPGRAGYEGTLPEPLIEYDSAILRGDPVLPLSFDLELRLADS